MTIPAGVPRQNPGQLVGLDGVSLPQNVFKARGRGQSQRPKKGGGGASYLNGLHRFGVEAGAVEKGGGSFGRNFMGGHDYSLGSR